MISKKAIGIEITDFEIRIAGVKKSLRGYSLVESDIFPLPEDASKDEVKECLKKVVKEKGLNLGCVTLAVSGKDTLIKTIELPPLRDAEVIQALKYAVEEHIPYPVSEVVYDYRLDSQRKLEEGEKRRALLTVAKKTAVMSHLNILQEVGAKSPQVTTIPTTLLDLCLEVKRDLKGNILFLDLISDRTGIALLRDGWVEVSQMTFIPSRAISQQLPPPLIEELLGQIETLLNCYRVKIDRVILCGGSKGIDQLLQERLKVVTERVDPLSSLRNKPEGDFPKTTAAVALNTLQREDHVNLFPLREELAGKQRKRSLRITGGLLLLIVVLIGGLLYLKFKNSQRRLEGIERALIEARPAVDQALKERDKYEHLQAELASLREMEVESPDYLEVLKELDAILPPEAWITSLTLEGRDIKDLTGNTTGSAAQLASRLEESLYFEGVEFSGGIRKEEVGSRETERFSLKVKINLPESLELSGRVDR